MSLSSHLRPIEPRHLAFCPLLHTAHTALMPPPSHLKQHSTRDRHSTTAGTRAGIILAAIFVVVAIKCAVWYSCVACRRRRERKIDQETRVQGQFQGGWAPLPEVKERGDEGEGNDGKGEGEGKGDGVTTRSWMSIRFIPVLPALRPRSWWSRYSTTQRRGTDISVSRKGIASV
jgi:hypothetical protein